MKYRPFRIRSLPRLPAQISRTDGGWLGFIGTSRKEHPHSSEPWDAWVKSDSGQGEPERQTPAYNAYLTLVAFFHRQFATVIILLQFSFSVFESIIGTGGMHWGLS